MPLHIFDARPTLVAGIRRPSPSAGAHPIRAVSRTRKCGGTAMRPRMLDRAVAGRCRRESTFSTHTRQTIAEMTQGAVWPGHTGSIPVIHRLIALDPIRTSGTSALRMYAGRSPMLCPVYLPLTCGGRAAPMSQPQHRDAHRYWRADVYCTSGDRMPPGGRRR